MSEFDNPERVVVYADYLCPFCYLGEESMRTYFEESGDDYEVEWRPFDIQGSKRRPDGTIDHDVDDGKGEAYFERVRDNVERLSREYGVEMSTDLPDDVDSWNAQKLALFVDENCDRETFRALHEGLYRALWRDERDIGDPEVLVEIADEVGIPEEEARRAIESDELDDELEERFEEARRQGVMGIPTFVHEDRAMQGAVPAEAFEQLLEE